MSKAMTTCQTLAMITSEAIDQLRYHKEHACWLEALMRAIRTDMKTGSHGAAALAELGQYLACALANYIDRQAEHFQNALDSAEGGK